MNRSEFGYVMYMGFPMKMSVNLDTNIPTISGFWSWVPVVFAVEPIGSEQMVGDLLNTRKVNT